eukprot:gene18061-biopygen14457
MAFHSVPWCRRRYSCTFQPFALEIAARRQSGASHMVTII